MQVTNSNKNIDTRYGDEVENQWKHSKGKTTTGVTYPKETIHYTKISFYNLAIKPQQ